MSHYNTTGLCPEHKLPAMKAINGMFLNCCVDTHLTCKKKCAKQAAKNYDNVEADNIILNLKVVKLEEQNKKQQIQIKQLIAEVEKVRHENPAYVLELIKHQLAAY